MGTEGAVSATGRDPIRARCKRPPNAVSGSRGTAAASARLSGRRVDAAGEHVDHALVLLEQAADLERGRGAGDDLR